VVAMFEAHPGGVAGVAYRNTGTQVLIGGADKLVKLWDLATGKAALSVGPLADPVTAVCFSRDYTAIAAAAGKVVHIWNAADGKEVATLKHPAAVTSLSYNADKSRIVTGAEDKLARVWDVTAGKEIEAFPHTGPVQAVAFHPSNTTIVSGGADKNATVHTLRFQRLVAASELPVRGLALAPNGTHVLTASDDKSVKMWNLTSGVNDRTFAGAEKPVQCVAVSKNNALVAAGDGATVRVYNFTDAKVLATLKAPGAVKSVSFSSNNQTLVAACDDRSIQTWNVVFTPGQPLPEEFGRPGLVYAHDDAVNDVTVAADGVTIYSGGADKTVKVWKIAGDIPARNLGHPGIVDAVAFNPAGTLLATGCHDGNLRLFDVAKGTQLRQIQAHTTPVPPKAIYCVAFTPDGKFVLSGSEDQTLKLWDASNGNLVRTFKAYKEKEFEKGHQGAVFCAAFSSDGKTLATGSNDHTIKLWNVADGSVVRELSNPALKPAPGHPPESHPAAVYGVRFTADGKQLLSVGQAPRNHGHLALWNVADGKLLASESLNLGPFYSLSIAPDGKSVAIGAGPRGRPGASDGNPTYILKMPEGK
jgi:WD40 repeat protein